MRIFEGTEALISQSVSTQSVPWRGVNQHHESSQEDRLTSSQVASVTPERATPVAIACGDLFSSTLKLWFDNIRQGTHMITMESIDTLTIARLRESVGRYAEEPNNAAAQFDLRSIDGLEKAVEHCWDLVMSKGYLWTRRRFTC